MRKIAALLIIVALGFVLAGCQTTTPSTGYYKFTGNQMIEAKFARDAPTSLETAPYEANEEIDTVVELTNKLTEDIPAGEVKVRLSGDATMPNFFVGAKEASNPLLSKINPETGTAAPEEVDLGPIKYIGEIVGKIQKTISGQFCYAHPVKVKANLYYTTKADEIGVTLPTGANPPSSVQVTKIEQRPVDVRAGKGTMKFDVTVANIGTGQLVDSLDSCFTYSGRRPKEKLNAEVKGAYPISCENEGVVVLQSDTRSKTFTCTVTDIDLANLGKHPSELSIVLSGFAYEQDIAPVQIWLESSE